MYQYKVDIYKVKYAEDAMNAYAKDGWRVIAVTPDHQTGFVDVFYERKAKEETETADVTAPEDETKTDVAEAAEAAAEEGESVQYAVREDIWDYRGSESEDKE